MSNYDAGLRPNISEYLKEIRAPSFEPNPEDMTFEDDLAMFTNTDFFDTDLGQNTDLQAQPPKPDDKTPTTATSTASTSPAADLSHFDNFDFLGGDFSFQDFGNTYASFTDGHPHAGTSQNGHGGGLGNLHPLQPNSTNLFHDPTNQHQQHPQPLQPQPVYGPRTGEKRKASTAAVAPATMPSRTLTHEEQNRIAAEEDKRRRNTAASARFRAKKKQREALMEQSAKSMNDRMSALEQHVAQLETENKWLKGLVMEKNGGSEDIARLLKEFSARQSPLLGDALSGKDAKQAPPKPVVPIEEPEGIETG